MAWKWPASSKNSTSEEWTGFIDQGVTLEGTLTVKGTFRVNGKVKGNIISEQTVILGEGAKLTLLGTAIGLAAAWGLTRLLVSLLFEVNASDPVTFVSISLLLISVGLIACFLPTRRALSVDPVIALRAE